MTTGCVLLPGGDVVVPAELLAALLAELELARAPMGVRISPRSAQIAALVDLMRQGAIAYRQRLRASCAVVAAVPIPAPSVARDGLTRHEGTVGVDGAAGLLGISQSRVKVLAAAGAFPEACCHRCRGNNGKAALALRWCLPVASVHAYLADRQVA